MIRPGVRRLAVHPAYQGGGIAGKLTTFAESYAADNGYTAIRLDTFSGNPIALHLYRKKGYSEAGTVRFRKGSFVVFEKKVMPR
ncbi:GNAT family N-acetyltransferase [Marispirochaeta sp.]|uniref:GNAT family N-acetyltransferase n=1 Tax=Marispirochaeta sp. TaxID=2038653 RepID=UPI003747AAE2